MKKLLFGICSYLEYLKADCNLSVSVHFAEETFIHLPKVAIESLIKYNSHTNPYCMAVKGKNHGKCIFEQRNIMKKCEAKESFLNICYAGVYEYICPILKNGAVVGFVAVSGYRKEATDVAEFKDLWQDELKKSKIPKEYLDSIIFPLCIMAGKLAEDFYEETEDEYKLILRYINEYHTNLTLDDLCKHFARSKSHISHLFKKSGGMTIRAYANELKLSDAHKMIKGTDLPITEIAYRAGFNDVSYFIKMFKEKYGISPLKMRKR